MGSKLDAQFAKATLWREEAIVLRQILLESGLSEEMKWGKPCYADDGRNIAIIQRMKSFLALMFFKGSLLDDPAGVLKSQGENSHAARRMEFTSVSEIENQADTIKAYLAKAIEAENSGEKVEKAGPLDLVGELQTVLDEDKALRSAFEALTPGRQRSYHLHISAAKQHATRLSRIEKCRDAIFAGKGFNER